MRRVLLGVLVIGLAGCSAEKERQEAAKEAISSSKVCSALPTHGERARCIGMRMLEADNRRGLDPKYDIQKINVMTQNEDAVDQGQLTEQDAMQRVMLAWSAIDAEAKSDDKARSAASRAAMGSAFARSMQGFSNGYNQGIRSIPVTPYRSPTTCMSQPSGGGVVTSCTN